MEFDDDSEILNGICTIYIYLFLTTLAVEFDHYQRRTFSSVNTRGGNTITTTIVFERRYDMFGKKEIIVVKDEIGVQVHKVTQETILQLNNTNQERLGFLPVFPEEISIQHDI